MKNNKKTTIIIVFLIFLSYISVLFLTKKITTNVKIDVTQNKIFTMSKGTKNILNNIKEPLIIKFYYSKRLGDFNQQFNRYIEKIKNTLKSYEQFSKNIKLEIYHTKPYSKSEKDALSYGLKPISFNNYYSEKMYLGLVISNSIGQKEIISSFKLQKQPVLEYDLSLLIKKLTTTKKPKIAILSALKDTQKFHMFAKLSSFFDIALLNNNFTTIDKSFYDVLVVILPSRMPDFKLLAIEQYLLSGGKLLIFTDPNLQMQKTNVRASSGKIFAKMLANWGIRYDYQNIVLDNGSALGVSMKAQKDNAQTTIPNPVWLRLSNKNITNLSSITVGINEILMATSGYFELNNDNVSMTPLLLSSKKARTIHDEIFTNYHSAEDFTGMFRIGDEQFSTCVMFEFDDINITFDHNLKNVYIKKDVKFKYNKLQEKAKIILVGDTDILHRKMWQNQNRGTMISDNLIFVQNIINYLTSNDDFLSLESRHKVKKTLKYLDIMKRNIAIKRIKTRQKLKDDLYILQSKINKELYYIKAFDTIDNKKQYKIEQLRIKMNEVNEKLKYVQYRFKEDAENLQNKTIWITTFIVPIFILLFGYLFIFRKMSY